MAAMCAEGMRSALGAAVELRPTTFAAPTISRQTGQLSPVHWWWTSLPSAIAERNVPTARSAASVSVNTRKVAARGTVWRMASCMGSDLPLRAEGTAAVEHGPGEVDGKAVHRAHVVGELLKGVAVDGGDAAALYAHQLARVLLALVYQAIEGDLTARGNNL